MTPIKQTHWLGIWFSFFTGVAAAITVTKASPALLEIQKEMTLSMIQVGWIMSSAALATVLLGLFAGSLSQRLGPKTVLQIALSLIIFSASFSLFIHTPNELVISRVIEGIAIILVSVSAPTLISHLSKPSDLGLTMGVWALWMPVGSVLVFLFAPLVITSLSWRWLWGGAALIALPLLLLSTRLTDPSRQAIRQPNDKPSRSVLLSAILMGTIFACFTASFFSLITYFPAYLVKVYHVDSATALLITTLLPAFIIPGNLLSGFLIHKGITPYQLMVYPAIMLLILISLLFHTDYPNIVGLGLLATYGLVLGMIPTAIFAQSPRLAEKPMHIGRIMGIVITGQGPGILFGPPLAGYLIGEQLVWQNLYPLYIILAITIVILATRLKSMQKAA